MSKPKEKKDPKQFAFKANCEVVLSEPELKVCAKTLAESLNGVNRVANELAAFKAQKKAEQTNLESIIERNTLLLNTGREFRMVECEWIHDWKAGEKKGFRKDTGECIATATITEEERQEHLPGIHSEAKS